MKPMKVSAANAAEYYYQRDPLFSHVDMTGSNAVWVGRGASTLGLQGRVNLEVFNNLLYGHDPSGSSRLVGRDNGDQAHHRNAATDIPLTAPKSFSVAGLFDLSVREAFDRAVTKTAEFIDNHVLSLAGRRMMALLSGYRARWSPPCSCTAPAGQTTSTCMPISSL